jgi:branched-subunit amino acid ABC-type transport system permease component
MGRWISPEPNVYNGEFDEAAGLLGYNVYAYCANNPIMFKDETGEGITLACVLIFGAIGAAVGGYAGYKLAQYYGVSKGERWKYVLNGIVIGGAGGALIGWGVGGVVSAAAATKVMPGITDRNIARTSNRETKLLLFAFIMFSSLFLPQGKKLPQRCLQ